MDPERIKLVEIVATAISELESETEILQAAVGIIDDFSDGYNWTGFYMARNGRLEVGPYLGPETEHTKIDLGDGICGAAAVAKKTITVDDVHADPRFLACSLTTRSEIVVPLMDGEECLGEIDIDSNQPSFFTDEDRTMLETVADVVVTRLKAIR